MELTCRHWSGVVRWVFGISYFGILMYPVIPEEICRHGDMLANPIKHRQRISSVSNSYFQPSVIDFINFMVANMWPYYVIMCEFSPILLQFLLLSCWNMQIYDICNQLYTEKQIYVWKYSNINLIAQCCHPINVIKADTEEPPYIITTWSIVKHYNMACTMHEKLCIDLRNARKFEKKCKIPSFTYVAITMTKLANINHQFKFMKLSEQYGIALKTVDA